MSGKKSVPASSRSSTSTTGKRKLTELSLVEDSGPKLLPGKAYDPYDKDPKLVGKAKLKAPKPDLRKLSQWIKLKREVDELKKADPEE
ncbi:MAG: hypothetical protein ABI859_06070 [Pseudomonadota bacterium]